MRLSRALVDRRRRRGVSEVIAVLLLVVMVIGLVIIVLTFGTGVIHSLLAGGVATPLTASGQMTVPGTTSQQGVLSLTLRNSQAVSIKGVAVTYPSGFSGSSPALQMTYQNVPVSLLAPGPPGQTLVGSAPVTSAAGTYFVAGTVYSILVQVTFTTGSQITLDVSVTAVS